MPETRLPLREILALPYSLEIGITQDANGGWVRQMRYPDIPGCAVAGEDVSALIDEIEALRLSLLIAQLAKGEPVSCARRPLPDGPISLSTERANDILTRLGHNDWLERLNEEFPVIIDTEKD